MYLGIILMRLTLDMIYIFIISPVYGYSGFLINFFTYKYVLSWLITLVMTPFIVNIYNNSSVSSIIVLLINLIYFIPGCTLYSLLGLPDLYFLFYILYWIILMFWQYRIPYVHLKLPSKRLSKVISIFLIISIALGAIVISGIYNGFQMNLHLDNVYELRAKQQAMELPGIVGYFQPIASAFIPLVLVYFLSKKKYFLSLITITLQMLLFSFGGMKFTLFMIPIAVLGFYIYREKRTSWFTWGLVTINLTALLEYAIRNSCYISAYLNRRMMLVTNYISYQYYDYFSAHSVDFLFRGILRRFGFISQYNIPIPRLIGLEYYGDIATNANNGMIGDAFSNFGWLGLVLFPLLIILALRFMDACAHGIDRRLLITIFVGFTISFINGAFFTVMLTNGFLFMCFALYFLPREGNILIRKETRDA